MESTRLRRLWCVACAVAALLANWVGGFSVVVTTVFVVIFLTGFILLGQSQGVVEGVAEDLSEHPADDSDEAMREGFDEPAFEEYHQQPQVEVSPEGVSQFHHEPYPDGDELTTADETDDDSTRMLIQRIDTAEDTAAVIV